jgi:hypothetical protein
MNIPIAIMMAVTYFLSSVKIVEKNMMAAAAKNVNPSIICPRENKKNYARER